MHSIGKRIFLLAFVVSLIASVLAAIIQQKEHGTSRSTTTLSALSLERAGAEISIASEDTDAPIYVLGGYVKPCVAASDKNRHYQGGVAVDGVRRFFRKPLPDDSECHVYLIENVVTGERSWAVLSIP